jgi:hypothetical protein
MNNSANKHILLCQMGGKVKGKGQVPSFKGQKRTFQISDVL